jgi:hypothetical protein
VDHTLGRREVGGGRRKVGGEQSNGRQHGQIRDGWMDTREIRTQRL